MNLTIHRPVDRDEDVYTLTVAGGDLRRMSLSDFDRALLRDCSGPDTSIADKLLALELLARRIEEQRPA